MKVEVTLQFEVPDDSDLDIVPKILKEIMPEFDYKSDLVQYTFITKPEQSILYKEDRLEHLERVISVLQELLSAERSIDANNCLSNHSKYFRDSRGIK